MGHVGAWIHGYFCKILRTPHVGAFKRAGGDFDKTWSACQRDDGSCCEKLSEFLVVTFSYYQTKR